ncbi:1-phosphatidylinositol-4,5-bisphosphate phosphodiesterase beta-2 [Gossypium australe]|uniref:1-phosphatidylinositol-4,5-bisphosphate phosphodiesterase beta-2 n=1 Tax=Gossypium australe TaxID=47621 RepID=A0A5B6W7M3_9ROSI|nr:1-phosphatidylinositol-4,5-bisphosphate phosphodiesterase beta-2 [Gossypium australe]
MSTRGTHRRGTRGHGRDRRGARAESSSLGGMPNLDTSETLVSLVTETGSGPHDRMAGDDALSQAMLRILERVVGPNTRAGGQGLVTERLRSNGIEIFKGVIGVTPNVAKYWIEAIKRIMDDLDCTPAQRLKGVVSLLCDEAYQWWLTVKEGTQPERLTWEFFKSAFQGKYVGASYMDARRREFLNLTQGDRSVPEYEAEFLRLSRYARGMVATEYERCVHFEDGLRVLIAPQRGRYFVALVDKVKIADEVKRAERQNRERGRSKRNLEPSSSVQKPKKKARVDGPIRVGTLSRRVLEKNWGLLDVRFIGASY